MVLPMRSVLPLLVFLLLAFPMPVALAGCAHSGAGRAAARASAPPPAGSRLARVTAGMNESRVRKILGEPDDSNAYVTGKAWIPFYYGSDTMRTDWMYRGVGRVVFSRNRYSGGLKVIRVIYNPSELK